MQHRLVVMWAPPRSLSTAFVRVIAERGDFTILHEPLCDLAACGSYSHKLTGLQSVELASPAALFEHVQALRADGQVFIKDTCEFAHDEVLSGSAYLREAQHVFMLRDPEKVINSHFHINPQLRSEEVGYRHLVRIYDLVKAESEHPPLFVTAEELTAAPTDTIERFCSQIGLQHLPSSLRWESGHLDIWERTQRWHLDVATSTGLAPIARKYAVRVDNHSVLQDFYQENLPFYNYLVARRAEVGSVMGT